MKNAGLNVAMDTFMTIPYGGVRGGLIVVITEEPGVYYSTRPADLYAEIPCLEPSVQEEARDMVR